MTAPRVNLLPHRAAKRERQRKLFWALTALSAVSRRRDDRRGLVGAAGLYREPAGAQRFHPQREQQARHPDQGNRDVAPGNRRPARAPDARSKTCRRTATNPFICSTRWRSRCRKVFTCGRSSRRTARSTCQGWAASNERVSEFLRNLQNNSRVLERPELIEIKVAGQGPAGMNRRVFEFALNFTMKPTPERTQLQQQAQAQPRAGAVAAGATTPTVAPTATPPATAPAPKK